jgi:hypothetical protein
MYVCGAERQKKKERGINGEVCGEVGNKVMPLLQSRNLRDSSSSS